jgi:hypothetical protein
MSSEFRPFGEGADSVGIGDLTIEDAGDSVAIYGSATIEATTHGLADAERLAAIANAMVARLKSMDLPDALAAPKITTRRNPFDE